MDHLRRICTYTATVLALWGCSGTDGYPNSPPAEGDITSPLHEESADRADATPPSLPLDDECQTDGAQSDCMTPIGTNAGFILCAQGVRTCSLGHWTACLTQATSAPVSGWEPASVGCNPPPEPCTRDGEARTCMKQLPPTPQAANCYHGSQVCSGNVWGPCLP